MRDLSLLPKAHLHLHFTGSMRHPTLVELAERDGISLPESLVSEWPPELSAADEKGWFRFQRLYDVARSVNAVIPPKRAAYPDGSTWISSHRPPSRTSSSAASSTSRRTSSSVRSTDRATS